jgi:hypothetical protein
MLLAESGDKGDWYESGNEKLKMLPLWQGYIALY